MAKHLIKRDSVFWFFDQKFVYEIDARTTAVSPLWRVENDLVFACHTNSFFLVVIVKRQTWTNESIQNTTQTPEVALERVRFLE